MAAEGVHRSALLHDLLQHGLRRGDGAAVQAPDAQLQKRRAKGHRGACEDDLRPLRQLQEPRHGLVDPGAAGDDRQVAPGQQVFAGGVRIVPGLGFPLQDELFLHRREQRPAVLRPEDAPQAEERSRHALPFAVAAVLAFAIVI